MLFLVRRREPEKREHPGGQTRPWGRGPADTRELAQTATVTALPMPQQQHHRGPGLRAWEASADTPEEKHGMIRRCFRNKEFPLLKSILTG